MRVRFECREEGGKYVPDLKKMLEAVSIINARIKDTGYQYYSIGPEGKAYIMLSGEDAERLRNERGWDLFTSVYEPAPELRKRLIDSIEYLRKMDFFEDYSSLSSEEILDKIFSGEICYEDAWWVDREITGHPQRWQGQALVESLREHEDIWLKDRVSEFDYKIALFDVKRAFEEDPETMPEKGMGIMLLKRFARISRGVFNPTDIREEWTSYPYKEFEKIKDRIPGFEGVSLGASKVDRCTVFFKFRGRSTTSTFTATEIFST